LSCEPKAGLLQQRIRPPQAKNTLRSDAFSFLPACGREERCPSAGPLFGVGWMGLLEQYDL
jgi:hypothetical protein